MNGRALAAATLAGLTLSFAFPEPDVWIVAWVGLVPLLVIARDRSALGGAALGFAFGVGLFGSLIVWIKYIGWVPWALLVILQASFVAAFGAGWTGIARRWGSGGIAALFAGALWVATEWLRSLVPAVGFTWGQLAQSQTDVAWLLRVAGLAGGGGLAWLIVGINALVAGAWAARRDTALALRRSAVAGGSIVVVVALAGLLASPTSDGRALRVAIVQGNVERDATGTTYDREIARIERHALLTRDLDDEDLDLVVWPESSVGTDPLRDRLTAELLGDAARAVGVPLIVGANLDVDEDRYQVVALHVSPVGEIVDRYQKTHLVPFGEYVPARSALDWIPLLDQVPRDAVPGDAPRNFEIDGVPISVVISFEGDFGPLVRERIALGGRALIVATNTSTWETSWASSQHLAFSRLRAAENGVPVIHGALSGISAFVAPDGSILARSELYEEAVLVAEITAATSVTPYARTGDWLLFVSLVAAVLGMVPLGIVRR